MAEYLCEENMSTGEYISRDEALKIFHQCCDNCTSSYNGVMCRVCAVSTLGAMDILIDIPAADVQPVKRGRWEEHHATYIKQLDAWFVQAKCSCCGRYSDKMDNYSQYLDLEYCSHCGAEMLTETDAKEIANCIEFRKRMKR